MPVAEGKIFSFENPDTIRADFLEAFEFDSPKQLITIETEELSAVCPFSGLPDYGLLKIEYRPEGGKCVELKSLKYYLISFRNVGLYQEGVTKKIYDDLKTLLDTDKIQISTLYNPRGGFETTCVEGEL